MCWFFFKQKTAYEMRISDWSSDVCSSDLLRGHTQVQGGVAYAAAQLLAMNDVAADGIGVAQQVFGAFQVTHGQGGAQLGTGNAVAVFVGYVRNGFDLEAEALAGAPQHLDIAAALVAVAEILDH